MPTRTMTTGFRSSRRGSVLIFALAILAVLALLGVTYVTRTNLDRVSVAAAEKRTSLERQPEVVIGHIQGLLTADLFGGKLVTASTPRNVPSNGIESRAGGGVTGASRTIGIWPTMFEDGEHWDYPSVNEVRYTDTDGTDGSVYTFERTELDIGDAMRDAAKLRFDSDLGRFETAEPDDAWLASTEPVDATGFEPIGSYDGRWDTWPQITNPRSAYRWVSDADGEDHGAWVRGDGRFADLSRFFLTAEASNLNRGDAGADLLDRANGVLPFYNPGDSSSVLPLDSEYNSALLGVEQRGIFGVQMNQVQEWYEANSFNPNTVENAFEPMDERFWADTDGDGRPDARWTVLDELDGTAGLRWVVAMRIVDSSAAVNVNASLESIPRLPAREYLAYGDGATPMDIDLLKLFYEGSTATNRSSMRASGSGDLRHPDVSSVSFSAVRDGFRFHFLEGLGLDTKFIEENVRDGYFGGSMHTGMLEFIGWDASDGTFAPNEMTPGATTRGQREAYWRLFAALPDQPLVNGGDRYDLGDEVDLRAAFGANFPGVRELEGRFDGVLDRLPGSVVSYPGSGSLGPMRAAEYTDAVSTRLLMGVARPGLSGGTYTQQDRIERIQKDIRRSLTMVNGASARSVVPNLGERSVAVGRLKPLVNEGSYTGDGEFQPSLDVRDSFEAFTWALAPLATNQPLMGALRSGPDTWADRYNDAYSLSPDFHYGGGANGPARAWALDLGAAPDTVGPAYALYRAASLAVNLRDAVDGEGAVPTPTVARLFFAPLIETNSYGNALDGVEVLTTRLAQGDVHDPLTEVQLNDGSGIIPLEIARPEDGVTFVGVDRQPFLSELYVMCLYDYEAPLAPSASDPPETVMISQGDEVGRAVVAIELINPWPDDILLTGYTVQLTDGAEVFELNLSGVTVPAGERHVVMWTNISGLEDGFSADDVVDISGSFLGGSFSVVSPNDESVAPFIEQFADPDHPFAEWDRSDSANFAMLLYRELPVGGGTPVKYLVDRMTKPSGEPFPFTYEDSGLVEVMVANPSATPISEGATFATTSSLSRSSGFPDDGGFPLEIIERREDNVVITYDPTDGAGAVGWHSTRSALTYLDLLEQMWGMDYTPGAPSTNDSIMIHSGYQMFVPDNRLIALGELGMVSTLATTYRHTDRNAPDVTVFDSDLAATRWTTFSEELGKVYHLNYDGTLGTPPGDSSTANPYLGVLDPTRFVLGKNGDLKSSFDTDLAFLPDAMSVPLASRVYDAFEVLGDTLNESGSPLIAGRINLNTAPKRVLATLPMVLPVDYDLGMPPGLSNTTNPNMSDTEAYERLNGLVQYRDRLSGTWSADDDELSRTPWDSHAPSKLIGLNTGGMLPRTRARYDESGMSLGLQTSNRVHRKDLGLVSIGELGMLGGWSTNGNNAPDADGTSGFLEFAEDMIDNSVGDNFVGPARQRDAIDVRPGGTFDGTNLEPMDDVEEQLSLFRAVSNVAGTRSDVFHAYFILRAYSPAAIESVLVPMGATDQEKAELLNDLPVEFEHRGMVVLDRSNVRQPTDRARVLVRTKLDSN